MDRELAAVERDVLTIRAAVLRCADINDDSAPAELIRLVDLALSDGCPPRTALRLVIEGFTAHASQAA